MRYQEGYKSRNTIDKRASSGRSGGGAVAGLAGGGGLIGLIVVLLSGVLGGGGIDLGQVLGGLQAQQAPAPTQSFDRNAPDPDAELASFVQFVFDDAQLMWHDILEGTSQPYRDATLVLFSNAVSTGCGNATSAVGPFYCPADERVYIDLDFYDDLARRFGAPGDFAQAYVVAHEVGHHLQTVLGISAQVRQLKQQNPRDANGYSVLQELQADCFAGVWAASVFEAGLLEPGDIEEGLAAAEAVGDDRIQSSAGVSITPETWTHGSSAQRQHWFTIGYETGDASKCNTFGR